METNKQQNSNLSEVAKSNYVSFKFKKPKPLVISIGVAAVLIIAALVFTKGFFVAATVNGSMISRWSVIKELEKQGGKQVLESLIDNKLVQTELNKQNVSVTQDEVDVEIKKIEAQIVAQGGTLDQVLEMQKITKDKLVEQITTQKKLEKLLANKLAISEAEINAYIKDTKAVAPSGVKMEDFRKQISDQLKQQKFQQEAQAWVSNLTTNAKIKYYKNY